MNANIPECKQCYYLVTTWLSHTGSTQYLIITSLENKESTNCHHLFSLSSNWSKYFVPISPRSDHVHSCMKYLRDNKSIL